MRANSLLVLYDVTQRSFHSAGLISKHALRLRHKQCKENSLMENRNRLNRMTVDLHPAPAGDFSKVSILTLKSNIGVLLIHICNY